MGDIITQVDKYKKGWQGGLPETPCGHGSKLSSTRAQREWIPQLVRKYHFRTVADIGAGDLNWIKHMQWPDDTVYMPFDLVPRHEEVVEFNLLEEVPPKVDLLLCLWVLNHFPKDHCIKAIENLRASGTPYLLVTDRKRWIKDQPLEMLDLVDAAVEVLVLNDKGDSIRLVELC